jgi:adenylyltransferase/sulfurtransferase
MMKKIAIFILIFSNLSFGQTSIKSVEKEIESDQAVLIDVREEDEIKAGMLRRAIWLPLSELTKNNQWQEKVKKMFAKKKVYLYCRSGIRAGRVQSMLKEIKIESINLGSYGELK